jgi:hypothetical protein
MDLIWVDCPEPEGLQLVKRQSIKHADLVKYTAQTKIYRDFGPPKYAFMNVSPALTRRRVPHALIGYSLIPDGEHKLLNPTVVNQTVMGLAEPGYLR